MIVRNIYEVKVLVNKEKEVKVVIGAPDFRDAIDAATQEIQENFEGDEDLPLEILSCALKARGVLIVPQKED